MPWLETSFGDSKTPRTGTIWTPSSPASTRTIAATSPCTRTGPSPGASRCAGTGRPSSTACRSFRAELVRSAQGQDAGWQEWYWHGTRVDGTRLEMRGVTIFGIQDDRIVWARLYMEEVDRTGEGIDQAVREITTSTE